MLADYLLGHPAAVVALRAALTDREHEPLHAPDLIEPEVLNALRRLVLRREITSQRAGEAVADLADVRLMHYPHAPLRDRVWALRGEMTAYDASYLALAEALEDPLLLTGDGGLAARARRSLGKAGVRLVR